MITTALLILFAIAVVFWIVVKALKLRIKNKK